jgi:predicted kinase
MVRESCVNLFAAYKARVRIVNLEVPEDRMHGQKRRRAAHVPAAVIDRRLDRGEVPDLTEVHQVVRNLLEQP